MWYRKATLGLVAGQLVVIGTFAQQDSPSKSPKQDNPVSKKDENSSNDPGKKEQPKIDSEEKNEIKKWSKEKLLKEMGKANHTLSREGQEWLKSKVRLEVLVNKEKAFYDELKADKSLKNAQEKLVGAKEDLAKLADITDDKEMQKELGKIIGKCDLKLSDIEKFIAFKESDYTIRTGEAALARISKLTDRALEIPVPQRALSTASSKSQVDSIASSIPDATGKVDTNRSNLDADPNIVKKLLEALSR